MRLLCHLASTQRSIVNILAPLIIVIICINIYIIVLKGSLGALMLTCIGNSAGIGKTIRLLVSLWSRDGVELLDRLCVQVLISEVRIVATHGIVLNLWSFEELLVNLRIIANLLLSFNQIHLLKILLWFRWLLWRIMRTLIAYIWHVITLVIDSLCRYAHLHAIVSLPWDSLICCWINHLREISFSSNFLRSSLILLRRRLLINLLLLHRIVLWTVVNRQFI